MNMMIGAVFRLESGLEPFWRATLESEMSKMFEFE